MSGFKLRPPSLASELKAVMYPPSRMDHWTQERKMLHAPDFIFIKENLFLSFSISADKVELYRPVLPFPIV